MKNYYKVLKISSQKIMFAINNPQETAEDEVRYFLDKIISDTSSEGINLDFADIKTLLENSKNSLIISTDKCKSTDTKKILQSIIKNEIIENEFKSKACGILLKFTINPNLSISTIAEIMDVVYEKMDEDADVIFGTNSDSSFSIDEIEVTIMISYM